MIKQGLISSRRIFLFLLAASFTLGACFDPPNPIIDLVLLKDVSDKDVRYTKFKEIKGIFDFDSYLYFEHVFRIRELSDVREGIVVQSHLPYSRSSQVPETIRKGQVRQFLARSEALLSTPIRQEGCQKSFVFYGIAKELNRLACSSQATNKIVIVNSNLLENNECFSVFNADYRELLFNHPDSVVRIFESQIPLENLKGISIYFVYRSKPETDHLFWEMTKLYTYYLGLKGARVEIANTFISSGTPLIQNRS